LVFSFNQFNKQVYYSVITNTFYIGQFKEVDKDNNLSNSSRYFYHTLDRILYVGDIKVSSKLVGDEIVPGGDMAHYVKSKDELLAHLKRKFGKSLENHKTTELDYISDFSDDVIEILFKNWLRFRKDLIDMMFGNEDVHSYAEIVKMLLASEGKQMGITTIEKPIIRTKFKRLQETGMEAENYFILHFDKEEKFQGGLLTDARLYGDG